MAQKILTIRTDDFDGSADAVAVAFGFGGVDYEIDLNAAHREELAKLLAPYIAKGRKAGRGRKAAAARPVKNSETGKIRKWAQAKGLPVSDRGRVSAEIVAEYRKAH